MGHLIFRLNNIAHLNGLLSRDYLECLAPCQYSNYFNQLFSAQDLRMDGSQTPVNRTATKIPAPQYNQERNLESKHAKEVIGLVDSISIFTFPRLFPRG